MEQKFISWLENHNSKSANASKTSNVILGIGDDGAIIQAGSNHRVLVADAIVDKVHFDLQKDDLQLIGHKALAVNLSDIAAMGAIPEAAIVTLVLPRSMTFQDAQQLFSGIADLANRYAVPVVGGDTARHDGALMLSITVTGSFGASFECPHGWRMDGAEIDDVILITGPLGGSIAGKHLGFDPRLNVAHAIQERITVNSATDVSDSLAVDLAHVLRKSNVGAVIDLEKVPVSESAKRLSSHSGKTALEHALYDGEDFELLLCVEPSQLQVLRSDPDFNFELYEIGRVTADHPGEIVEGTSQEVIAVQGYEH